MSAETGIFLDLDSLSPCTSCNFRRFDPGELHVIRVSDSDVLLLMLEGELIFYEDGVRTVLRPGEWYIQQAGRFQEGREESLAPVYFYLHFKGRCCASPRHPLPLSGRFQPEDFLPLLKKMDKVWHLDGSEAARQAAFFGIFAALETAAPAPLCSAAVARMTAYLAEHLSEPVRLSDLAKEFRYSEDHIIRLFRRQKGVTPHQLLQSMRLRQAQQLLENTDRTITAIAAQTGYRDPSAFYRAFRRTAGCSPEAWRARRSLPPKLLPVPEKPS